MRTRAIPEHLRGRQGAIQIQVYFTLQENFKSSDHLCPLQTYRRIEIRKWISLHASDNDVSIIARRIRRALPISAFDVSSLPGCRRWSASRAPGSFVVCVAAACPPGSQCRCLNPITRVTVCRLASLEECDLAGTSYMSYTRSCLSMSSTPIRTCQTNSECCVSHSRHAHCDCW